MRVSTSDTTKATGTISFGHAGEWFHPRKSEDFIISQGKEITDMAPAPQAVQMSTRKVVAIDKLLDKGEKTLRRNGNVLVCGGRGAGKTAVINNLSQRLHNHLHCTPRPTPQEQPPPTKPSPPHSFTCSNYILDTVHASCGAIADSSLSTIKDTLQKYFTEATFHAPSLITLDNLDRLLPAELEHADSTRSRQIAEIFLHIARPALYRSQIVLIASAPSVESLHSVVTSGFIFRETVALKAPDKEARRRIVEEAVREEGGEGETDGLEVAGMTDGYLPGDLHALVERARQEAIVRCLEMGGEGEVRLETVDFESAVRRYVPASLRGVKLQKSTVNWNDIGGTKSTLDDD